MTAIELLIEVLSWAFLMSGSVFMLIGALGTLRFPDFWSRVHAVSVTDSAGMILLTAGMIMQAGLTLISVKLIMIGIFLFITGPTATHAVANAALVSGILPKGNKVPKLANKKTKAVNATTPKTTRPKKAKG